MSEHEIIWLESVPSGIRWFCLDCKAKPVTGLGELDYEEAQRLMQHTDDRAAEDRAPERES